MPAFKWPQCHSLANCICQTGDVAFVALSVGFICYVARILFAVVVASCSILMDLNCAVDLYVSFMDKTIIVLLEHISVVLVVTGNYMWSHSIYLSVLQNSK